jgi:hypothetical protein
MSDDAVDELLRAAEWGTLALADGGEPYSIPISFGYDGTDVYFGLVEEGSTNVKRSFIADGARARLLVTDIKSQFDWRSAAVTGTARPVEPSGDRWETLQGLLGENSWFSTTSERTDATEGETGGVHGWWLDPDEVDGREVRPVY